MESLIQKFGTIINNKGLSEDELQRYKHLFKISYKSDFPLLISTSNNNYSLNVLYTGGLKTYVNNTSNAEKGFTTDIGWGCMIRSMQTLLANAIRLEMLSLNTLLDTTYDEKQENTDLYIAELFKDESDYPFSIHNITKLGFELFKVNVGDWFGPSIGAQCIQKIISTQKEFPIDECFVSVDSGTIYEDELQDYFSKHPAKSVLVLLCVRLGLNSINDEYIESFYDLFESGKGYKFAGIAGGKPFKSLYFFDRKGNSLVYSDPHHVSNYSDLITNNNIMKDFKDNYKVDTATIEELDPSMCIGYVINSSEGLANMKNKHQNSNIISFKNKKHELDMLINLDVESCY